jgi:hypothetical protein
MTLLLTRWQHEDRRHWRSGKYRKRRQRGWPRALRVRAGRIGVSMVMIPSVVVATVMLHGARRVHSAHHDFGSAIDRLEHEAGGDQRPEHERRRHPHRESQAMLSEQRKSWDQAEKSTSAREWYPYGIHSSPTNDMLPGGIDMVITASAIIGMR